jgi:DNA-binding GntR family transcriptional regulator
MRLKLIEARRMVEVEMVGLAAQRATEEHVTQLRGLFDGYRTAIEARAFAHAGRANYQFHMLLAKMTQNPFVAPMLDHLLRTVPTSLRESEFFLLPDHKIAEIVAVEVELHSRLLAAMAAHDGEEARAAMEAHMRFEEESVRRAFAPAGG